MQLEPGGILLWLVVGLIAGWAASHVSRGHGFGLLGDIVVGLTGALIGGFLASLFIQGSLGFAGTVIVAFVGALILLAVFRAFAGRRIQT